MEDTQPRSSEPETVSEWLERGLCLESAEIMLGIRMVKGCPGCPGVMVRETLLLEEYPLFEPLETR